MIFCCMFRSLIVLCIFVMARVGGFVLFVGLLFGCLYFCVLFTVLVMFGFGFGVWVLGFSVV